ncbi:ABC transporter ATP-binding protein [Levilactobacillus parabrevis]|uniref:ABC-type quaternary amine transporter n=1 Tax=Levilactobacillus parabrevis ATCC 53295 TaxID=1267003 RepID=A0A0R1H8T7_9LACO|nr:ABC transporter ATP-binding protein [Levilactobacillus parabrevis]KRK39351.1 ABC-type proline glycine betaine transport system, ATPase component [Levilactobacillus parabrevis ATCC 53295]KRO07252.1 ABC-type proline glycine betaine transport system, ATPase component [Levilactobacillus parabrevis]MCT4487672.1 ABC transporter ATP-binding protein [Levilactobacillus parabrevis]MCT4489310.1 ABC transporter ATP-binding protein [Levilactobacillus parabrevis]
MIEFKNVSKQYENNLALDKLNLTIPSQDFFVLVGPSGSGKTTTLKMLNRLIEPTDGNIYFDDKRIIDYDLKQLRLQMGYVLQNIALFPNLNIQENIAIQAESLGWSRKDRIARARHLLSQVDLDPDQYATRMPSELSGGEQQRVGIIRALAIKPKVVLMDEPFSALDPISRKQLQDLVLRLHRELKMTFIFVTHDMHEALRLGQHIAVMRLGHIQQIGTGDEIMQHPANDFVRGFFQNEHAPRPTTVQSLLDAGYGEATTAAATLTADASVSALAAALKQTTPVVVTTVQGPRALSTPDLLDYLAAKEAD